MKVGDVVRVVEHADYTFSPTPYDEIGQGGVVSNYGGPGLVFVILDGWIMPLAYAERQLEVVKE